MERDPFYQEILRRLNRHIDEDLFQTCVGDLLRKDFPGIVAYRGGDDAGMDGAIPDGKGEPFPLIVTAGGRALDNLTRNLEKYLSSGLKRRFAVFATSRPLTNRQVRNLNKRAESLGFSLVQVYPQEAIARLLYRSPEWCRDLLGLTGKPAALSTFPLTTRPLLGGPMIGRDADLDWLRNTTGDRLLVGQPGSGKTFLLYQLTLEGRGLFVVSDDLAEIANGIRSSEPGVLFVDDAHLKIDLLLHLRQLQHELGAMFSIVASCWFGVQNQVVDALDLSASQIRELDLLTRSEIVAVIHETGIGGPDELVREITNQAMGRPGLAVTLARLCIAGDARDVYFGEALSSRTLALFEPILKRRVAPILAAFSLGGEAGMKTAAVAGFLGTSQLEIWEAVTFLADGGIIWDMGAGYLSVHPAALRFVLVRDVFFTGFYSFELEPILAVSPELSESVRTLIGARFRGARVSSHLLSQLLERVNSPETWEEFAWLGPEEASWVIRNHPERLVTIARPALEQFPDGAIPPLLESAASDMQPLHSATDHPLRLIQDWIHRTGGQAEAQVRRRNVLLACALSWLRQGRNRQSGIQALTLAFSPKFMGVSSDPGENSKVTIRYGYLPSRSLDEIAGLWSKVTPILPTIGSQEWNFFFEMIDEWIYPGVWFPNVSAEISNQMKDFGKCMIHDIAPYLAEHPALLQGIRRRAKDLDLDLQVVIDPSYEILYPSEEDWIGDDWHSAEEQQRLKVDQLAHQWSQREPEDVICQLLQIENEAQLAQSSWPRWTYRLCREIANRLDHPAAWVVVWIERKVSPYLIEPLLEQAARINDERWEEIYAVCLESELYSSSALSLILTLLDPPEFLLKRAFEKLTGQSGLVDTLLIQKRVSKKTQALLLRHPDRKVASSAAFAIWQADPKAEVDVELFQDWENIILDCCDDDRHLSMIFERFPEMGRRWARIHLGRDDFNPLDFQRAVRTALHGIDEMSRVGLLDQIPASYAYEEVISSLVGNSLVVFQTLLQNPGLVNFHLAPLHSERFDDDWIEMVKLALEAGHSPEEIASAALHQHHGIISWSGSESKMWQAWVDRFTPLCSHKDEHIRAVGDEGKSFAEQQFARAEAEERDEEIFGWSRIHRWKRKKIQ